MARSRAPRRARPRGCCHRPRSSPADRLPARAVPYNSSFRAELRHGWDGEVPVAAVHRDAFGRVVGVLAVHLPRRDNRHVGHLEITVDPEDRRRGLGRTLYEAGVERLRQEGRTLVLVDCFDIPHSQAFAKSIGVDRASAEVKRRQHVMRHEVDRRAHHLSLAETGAGSLRAPPDAGDHPRPHDACSRRDGRGDQRRTHRRPRRRGRGVHPGTDARPSGVPARASPPHVSTGRAAAEQRRARGPHGRRRGERAAVVRPPVRHKRACRPPGNRLGLLLKIGMLRWLAEAEPQLRVIDTWNAASNHHMIAVNQILGYEVVATATRYQSHV